MIDMLETKPDVIALKVSGKLSRHELERITELVERSLAEQDKTHIYVEVTDYSGFDLSALPDYLPRAAKMLGKLDRFGRIAVVAEAAWVRWATRLESALLPHVHYETFTPDERDRVLSWVEGRTALPHGPALKIIESDRADVLGFEIDGRISAIEMRAIAERVMNMLDARSGRISILGRFKHFAMPELSGVLDAYYVRMKMSAAQRVDRYAVVGGPPWLSGWVSAFAPLLSMEFRHFPAEEESAAWEWLGAKPGAEHTLAA